MQIGIFAKTFPGDDPAQVLGAARNAGYECVQYNWACAGLESMPGKVPESSLIATQDALRNNGMNAVALSGTFNMIHPVIAVRQQGLARLNTVIDSAATLGIPMVTLCTGSRNASDQWSDHPDNNSAAAWSDMMSSMSEAMSMAELHGICLGVEPELANTINSIEKAQRLMKEFDSPHLRIVLDPANLFEVVSDSERRFVIERAVDVLGPFISLCHAKDRLANGEFCVAGDGVIDYPHYLSCLQSINYEGALVTHGLEQKDAPGVARYLSALLAELP